MTKDIKPGWKTVKTDIRMGILMMTLLIIIIIMKHVMLKVMKKDMKKVIIMVKPHMTKNRKRRIGNY